MSWVGGSGPRLVPQALQPGPWQAVASPEAAALG